MSDLRVDGCGDSGTPSKRDPESSSSSAPPLAARLVTLIELLNEAHMYACDLASNGIEPEKLNVIGQALRESRKALLAARLVEPPLKQIVCEDCEGQGWVEVETSGPAGTMSDTCPNCEGEGVLYLVAKSRLQAGRLVDPSPPTQEPPLQPQNYYRVDEWIERIREWAALRDRDYDCCRWCAVRVPHHYEECPVGKLLAAADRFQYTMHRYGDLSTAPPFQNAARVDPSPPVSFRSLLERAANGLTQGACFTCGAEPGVNIDCLGCRWVSDAQKALQAARVDPPEDEEIQKWREWNAKPGRLVDPQLAWRHARLRDWLATAIETVDQRELAQSIREFLDADLENAATTGRLVDPSPQQTKAEDVMRAVEPMERYDLLTAAIGELIREWRADAAFNPRETSPGYVCGREKSARELDAVARRCAGQGVR